MSDLCPQSICALIHFESRSSLVYCIKLGGCLETVLHSLPTGMITIVSTTVVLCHTQSFTGAVALTRQTAVHLRVQADVKDRWYDWRRRTLDSHENQKMAHNSIIQLSHSKMAELVLASRSWWTNVAMHWWPWPSCRPADYFDTVLCAVVQEACLSVCLSLSWCLCSVHKQACIEPVWDNLVSDRVLRPSVHWAVPCCVLHTGVHSTCLFSHTSPPVSVPFCLLIVPF